MNEVTLPPSPNWYLSHILSCANDGTVAWGARNSIVVAKPQAHSKILRYSLIGNAHPEKVTSLAFSPDYGSKDNNFLVSGGHEHIVRVWNLDTMSAVHSQAFTDTKQKVIAVDWSKCDPDLVCFVSSDGLLMSWKIPYNGCQLFCLGKFTATCLACSPHKPNIVAVGTKAGLVYIVNLQGNGTINYKLRGHDVEITSLSWCPSDENIFNDLGSKDMLLASGAKDRSVFVWRAGTDGRYQIEISIPVAPMDSQQHKVKLNSSIGNWTAVCWSEPRLLLASSSWGELISWDLTMGLKNKPICRLIHGYHGRGLFCIANVPRKIPIQEENWRETAPTTVWTLGQDRQVIRSSVTALECKIEYSVPTQGGYVYCMAPCPLDTSRIAFGVGDAMLRLWNLSEAHETSFDVSSQWQKIMGKIRSIAWHPEKENLLAFGTGEGRVGIWDTNTNTKPPILYRQYHRNTVYSLGWGPNPSDKNFVLYSCGDNELVYYPSEKPTKEAKTVIKKDCTEFAWKPDHSCMAVGYEDGSILFMDKNLQGIGKPIYALKKAVQCLAWHPDSTSTDLDFSPLRNYLAVAVNSPTITIIDLTDMMKLMKCREEIKEPEEISSGTVSQHKIVANLKGHSEKIVCLAWSSHFSGHLVSGSYDHTAQIWKIETQELIATYVDHVGPVQCCMWSPLDPDYVITGSSDFTVRVWKISDQKIVFPCERAKPKSVKTKKRSRKTASTLPSESITEPETPNNAGEETEKVPTNQTAEIPEDDNFPTSKKERPKKASYLSAYSKSLNDKNLFVKSLRNLGKIVRQSKTSEVTNGKVVEDDDESPPTIFGGPEDLAAILDREISSNVTQAHYNMSTEISMWNNSLRKNLSEATREKRLNDFLVSLSAGLSMKTWRETCEAYATQLLLESNPNKAVSYLLCVHKIHRAIEIFIEQRMYKEAYVLARSRLDEADPILPRILEDWANNASKAGNFDEAAQCYVKLGDFAKAAKFLGRRKDVKILEIATEFAEFTDESGLAESLAEQTFLETLGAKDFSNARRLVEKFSQINHRRAQINVFEEMKKILEATSGTCEISDWLEGRSNFDLLKELRSMCEPFAEHYTILSRTTSLPNPESEPILWIAVSHQMAMYATADTRERQMSHLVATLGAISQYEIVYPKKTDGKSLLIRILAILENKSPRNNESLFANEDLDAYKSLRAFLCLGLVEWLLEGGTKDCENLEALLDFVGKLLADALDSRTVKYWTVTNEVNKLEASLASALGKSQKAAHDEEPEDETSRLLERLNTIRSEKKSFLETRICAPSPILAYSKATQLSDILPDGSAKDSFVKILSETWSRAIS